jgi:hypothetical protein
VLVTQGLGLPGAGARGGIQSTLTELAEAARAARVSFYAVLMEPDAAADVESNITMSQLVDDQELKRRPLEYLADQARGTVLRGAPEAAFERIAREITGHYELGIEPEDKDRDGKPHEITVKVRHPGLTVRVARDVVVPKPGARPDERTALISLLNSPVPATALPLRTATWIMKDVETGKLRLLIEADAAGLPVPAAASLAYVLLDDAGKPAATGLQMFREHAESTSAEAMVVDVEPGHFRLRVAARDRLGRAGSLEHPVAVSLQASEGVEVSDLLLGPVPKTERAFRPAPEPRVSQTEGALLGHLELYAARPELLGPLRVWVEICRPTAPTPLRTLPTRILKTPQAERIVIQTLIRANELEAGDYMARADVFLGERILATVSRAFLVTAQSDRPTER